MREKDKIASIWKATATLSAKGGSWCVVWTEKLGDQISCSGKDGKSCESSHSGDDGTGNELVRARSGARRSAVVRGAAGAGAT